jgi:predicted small integral membrane protein
MAAAVIEARLAKTAMVASLAVFALVVAYDNLVDWGANYAFVRHVLSMDTTFPESALRGRAIADPRIWQAAYALIIAAEALTGLAFAAGAVAMARALGAEAARFNRAKRFTYLGAALGFLVWFTGFAVVGGEWFAMWQSQIWNGQQAAFRFTMTILGVAIFVAQRDDELEGRRRPSAPPPPAAAPES